jgi:predicted HTH transcriptional regulator
MRKYCRGGTKKTFIEYMLQEILKTLKQHQGAPIEQENEKQVRDKFGISSEQIIERIRQNKHITLDEIASELKVTRRTVEKKMRELKAAGIVKRTGSNKTGSWEINTEY